MQKVWLIRIQIGCSYPLKQSIWIEHIQWFFENLETAPKFWGEVENSAAIVIVFGMISVTKSMKLGLLKNVRLDEWN